VPEMWCYAQVPRLGWHLDKYKIVGISETHSFPGTFASSIYMPARPAIRKDEPPFVRRYPEKALESLAQLAAAVMPPLAWARPLTPDGDADGDGDADADPDADGLEEDVAAGDCVAASDADGVGEAEGSAARPV